MNKILLLLPLILFLVIGCRQLVYRDQAEKREGIWYRKGSDAPYTGKIISLYENGQPMNEGKYKDGKLHGLTVWWHENEQKKLKENYKNGRPVKGSQKYWNSKGEPVDSIEEAEAE
jgi:antitoxin component YwqK of YwqJK toxin-antitoxin module